MKTSQVIRLYGELDFADVQALAARLREASEHNPLLTADLRKLDFMDCAVLGAIVAARNQARQDGGDIILSSPQGAVRRLLTLLDFPFRELCAILRPGGPPIWLLLLGRLPDHSVFPGW